MLALDDAELKIVMDCARPLAPKDRSEFLEAVAVELGKYEQLGPGIVSRVTAATQRKYFAAPSFHGNGGGGKYRSRPNLPTLNQTILERLPRCLSPNLCTFPFCDFETECLRMWK
jgi:hypothetical protein